MSNAFDLATGGGGGGGSAFFQENPTSIISSIPTTTALTTAYTYSGSNPALLQSISVANTNELSDTIITVSLPEKTNGWDITDASFTTNELDVSSEATSNYGLFFKPDGLTMFVASFNTSDVYQYTLSTAWDLSTASYDSIFFDSGETSLYYGIWFKDDGTKMYICAGNPAIEIVQFTLSTPWDITTATDDATPLDVSSEDGAPNSIVFNNDGTKLYMCGANTRTVYQYDVSTPWDLSTASYSSNSLDTSIEFATFARGIFFDTTGTRLFIGEWTSVYIHEYLLTTPWDLSTATYTHRTFDASNESTAVQGIFFRPDGSNFYTVDFDNTVNEYAIPLEGLNLVYNDTVPISTASELMIEPVVLQTGDVIQVQADIPNDVQFTISVAEETISSYYRAYESLLANVEYTLATGSSNGDIIRSIRLVNDDPSPPSPETPGQVDVWWEDDLNNKTYIVRYFDVFPGMSVELLEKEKFISSGYTLKALSYEDERVDVIVTGLPK